MAWLGAAAMFLLVLSPRALLRALLGAVIGVVLLVLLLALAGAP